VSSYSVHVCKGIQRILTVQPWPNATTLGMATTCKINDQSTVMSSRTYGISVEASIIMMTVLIVFIV